MARNFDYGWRVLFCTNALHIYQILHDSSIPFPICVRHRGGASFQLRQLWAEYPLKIRDPFRVWDLCKKGKLHAAASFLLGSFRRPWQAPRQALDAGLRLQ